MQNTRETVSPHCPECFDISHVHVVQIFDVAYFGAGLHVPSPEYLVGCQYICRKVATEDLDISCEYRSHDGILFIIILHRTVHAFLNV